MCQVNLLPVSSVHTRNLDRVVEMNILGGKNATAKLHTSGDREDLGAISEMNSVYWLDQSNIKVTQFEPTIPGLATKPIDFVADNGLNYQNAATTNALRSKLQGLKLKQTAEGILAVEKSSPGSFRFLGSDIDKSNLDDVLGHLNAELVSLQDLAGIPATDRIRALGLIDVVVLPWQ